MQTNNERESLYVINSNRIKNCKNPSQLIVSRDNFQINQKVNFNDSPSEANNADLLLSYKSSYKSDQ